MDVLISREINDDFMLVFKGVEQDPYLGLNIVRPSIDDDSKATVSKIEENTDENVPNTPYNSENMNAFSNDEGNNEKDSPKLPYEGENINDYSNNEGINDEVDPD